MSWRRRKTKFVLLLIVLLVVAYYYLFKNLELHDDTDQLTNGFLNVAVWKEICGDDMRTLKELPVFHYGPSTRLRTASLRLNFKPEFEHFGLRIYGFLSPIEAGNYTFYLASSKTSELWISSDSKPENSKLIANTAAGLSRTYGDRDIALLTGKLYYLEVLLKHGSYQGKPHYMHVTWRSSNWSDEKEIPSDVFIPLERNLSGFKQFQTFDHGAKPVLPIHAKQHDPIFVNEEVKRRAEMYRLPFISESDSQNLFPLCPYNPSYLTGKHLKRYQSTWEMHYTSIYPEDHADIVSAISHGSKTEFVSFSNDPLDEKTAVAIASKVWAQIQRKHPRKYSLRRILNVEENHDEKRGDRYLVELELEEITSGKSARFSEYVYKQRGVDTLCTPEGMTWNKSAVINILLTTGNNQGRWILHFLENMARIYSETKDSKVNVIIVDFDSKDLDIEKALKRAAIPNYQYANKNDKFSRASGLQRAAEMVKEPNSIVFAMDLHLDIPYHFLDDVRKHCVQHKMAYGPVLVRLECGATPSRPFGFWEVGGLGLIGMYKSDWDKVGGMNEKEFVNWGGEDWELCDRILENTMEVERLKMIHFFHYFHTNKGMWGNARRPSTDEKCWF